MRNVFFGTSDFAATVLERLAASTQHRPQLLVTRPARPRGRGKRLLDPPVVEVAVAHGIEVFQPEDVNAPESVERIAAAEPEALTVCAYGALIGTELLELAPSFNVHPSLLPRWRGAAPVERAIIAGDEQTGVSIMRLVEELDAGPYCRQQAVEINGAEYGTLAPVLAELGGDLLVDALDGAAAGGLEWTEQSDAVTYAEKITREDRVLRPQEMPAAAIERTVRALTPQIGALLETTGEPLRVERVAVVERELAPGEVVAEDGRLLVGTPELTIELLQVRPAGGRSMDVESFLRGNDAPELNERERT